jgi:methionine synthase I (cobalamin-dependent)/5,10-methylenetetrahydrofolate reductase
VAFWWCLMDGYPRPGYHPERELNLYRRVWVCDGAMGTMLHSAGVPLDRSLSELNVVKPHLVRDLHAAYLAAGADIIQTNTFDANRLRLARTGLQESVAEINLSGARLAREAVRESGSTALVAGSVGPVMSAAAPRIPYRDRDPILREQIAALASWVDLIMLETFGDIESLEQAATVALAECDLPVIAQLTFGDDGRTLRGEEPREAAAALAALKVAAIGANCTVGPAVLQEVVAELAAGCTLPIIVQPNAGVPRRLGRQLRYARNTEYFAEAARQFVASGATLVGGCCGTTPAHIRAVARSVPQLKPGRVAAGTSPCQPRSVIRVVSPKPDPGPPAGWPHQGRFVVVAGVRAPRGQDVAQFTADAAQLVSAGADILAITDQETSAARVSPVAAAAVLRERAGTDVILNMETAGRSLAALEADLLGGYALGVRTVVCRSGTPWVAGDYPEPYSPGDVDSLRLITALAALNEGVDWRGVTAADRTRFVIGACVHTAAADTGQELGRTAKKAEAGAHFLVTDVIYDPSPATYLLRELRSRGVDLPVIAAFAPFGDPKAITRLIHEVPGAALPSGAGATRATRRDEPADPVSAVLDSVASLADLIVGVLIHAPSRPDERLTDLITGLATIRRAS